MREGTIHENDCGNCRHWIPWTDEEWKAYCRQCEELCLKRPEKRYDLGWCDKIQKGTVYDENEGWKYDGYSFSDECYDESLHCFEG